MQTPSPTEQPQKKSDKVLVTFQAVNQCEKLIADLLSIDEMRNYSVMLQEALKRCMESRFWLDHTIKFMREIEAQRAKEKGEKDFVLGK